MSNPRGKSFIGLQFWSRLLLFRLYSRMFHIFAAGSFEDYGCFMVLMFQKFEDYVVSDFRTSVQQSLFSPQDWLSAVCWVCGLDLYLFSIKGVSWCLEDFQLQRFHDLCSDITESSEFWWHFSIQHRTCFPDIMFFSLLSLCLYPSLFPSI